MRYPAEVIEEVRSRNNIVDVVGSYVHLQKKGSNYFGLCPFHNEKSGSFSVSPSKQMYYCFGCGAGGNVISFVMEYENYTFQEAVEKLADRAGVTLPQVSYSEEEKREASEKMDLLNIQKEAATYYFYQLRREAGKKGLDYLKRRGLSDETIKKFGLGYAPATSNGIYQYLKKKGYSDERIRNSGLVNMKEARVMDKFWNRVMFPIMDVNNKVVGFGGRVMGEGEPKYLNSPETKVFDKSRNLYGLNEARKSRKNYMLLCEGYMDVISMHQAGFTNAVASLGTAFTVQHSLLLKRYTEEVILTYDSDDAGVRAALRAIPILKEAGLPAKVLNMKPYKDPDEFIKNLGAEEFQKRIDEAENSFLFEIEVMRRRYQLNDPEEKKRFHYEVAERLTEFTEELERLSYMEAVSRRFMIPYDALKKLVNKKGEEGVAQRERKESYKPVDKKKNREEGMKQSQKLLLTWISEEPEVYHKIKTVITPSDFTESLYRDMAEMLFAQAEKGQVNPAELLNHFLDEEDYKEASSVFQTKLSEQLDGQQREQAFRDIVLRVKENSLEDKSRKVQDISELQKIIAEKAGLSRLHISL